MALTPGITTLQAQTSYRPVQNLTPAERAARTINDAINSVTRAESLDEHLGAGASNKYRQVSTPSQLPFQKIKMYNIPDQIFEQYNRAQVSTSMGLFAELHYAWVSIDNALYMWDYTLSQPELLGYEDQPHSITAVKLATPKPGVFLANIQHMVVLATTDQITILGLGVDTATESNNLALFQTGMTASTRGLDVSVIASSSATGRIFFAGRSDNELRELHYQARDSWFTSKCTILSHTLSSLSAFTAPIARVFNSATLEYVEQIEIDDSRMLLYTLSSQSNLRFFQISTDNGALVSKKEYRRVDMLENAAHSLGRTNATLSPTTKVVSISCIPRFESQLYHLVATTQTGYRLWLSAYSLSRSPGTDLYTPDSIMCRVVKTPPCGIRRDGTVMAIDEANYSLTTTTKARIFAPAYFFCAYTPSATAPTDKLFIGVADTNRADGRGGENKMNEDYCVVDLNSKVEDMNVSVPYIPPVQGQKGYGYEMTVQYDNPVPEVAVLTNTGVHVFKRQRLVDRFSAILRQGGGARGAESEITDMMSTYGWEEVLASALAVACGQSMNNSQERSFRVNDPEVLDAARKVYIDYGGKSSIEVNNRNPNLPPIDTVRLSPRHDATVLYISRLVRSAWKQVVALEERTPAGYAIVSAVKAEKLRAIQEDLTTLQRFFTVNKSFIRGLSGPDDLGQQANKDEEIALQAEHRSFHALVTFVTEMIEAISFVLVLFEEVVAEIVPLLPEQSRAHFFKLTYEELLATKQGYDVAKDLVKAIVNRNIAKGSNVETIAEALRRKCGNFCSADDVVIFKAQEQLKRAAEAKDNQEYSRNLLNESLKLFGQVAHRLSQEYLQTAVNEYLSLQFFAGAIQLCLKVAYEQDKTNDALAWMKDGSVDSDPRKAIYEARNKCYDLIHAIIEAIDKAVQEQPTFADGSPTLIVTRRQEAYEVIAKTGDQVFLTNLYDWYLSKGWADRLLATDSPFVVVYLQRKSETAEDSTFGDLLWKYYGQNQQFHEAGAVQLGLAKSDYNLSLDQRIEYLSRARAGVSTQTATSVIHRKAKQRLLLEINELMDTASIQSDILQRLRNDPRTNDRSQQILAELDGPILSNSELFNSYADSAGYYDICLLIFHISDYRDATTIKQTWQQLLESTHEQAVANANGEAGTVTGPNATPYETIAETVRTLGGRLRMSETVFPVPTLIDMLENYNIRQQASNSNVPEELVHWVPEIFIELGVPYELIYDVLETLYFTTLQDSSSNSRQKRVVLSDLLHVIERWLQQSYSRTNQTLFDGESGQARIQELLLYVSEQDDTRKLGETVWQRASILKDRVVEMVA